MHSLTNKRTLCVWLASGWSNHTRPFFFFFSLRCWWPQGYLGTACPSAFPIQFRPRHSTAVTEKNRVPSFLASASFLSLVDRLLGFCTDACQFFQLRLRGRRQAPKLQTCVLASRLLQRCDMECKLLRTPCPKNTCRPTRPARGRRQRTVSASRRHGARRTATGARKFSSTALL